MLYDDIAAALPEMRAHAESRMRSTATVSRATGRIEQDPTTGLEVPILAVVHTGRMRLATVRSSSRAQSTPGGDVQLAVREAHFPASTAPFNDGDLIEITNGEAAGTFWHVVDSDRADQQTAYRVPVVAAQPIGDAG